MDSLLFNTEDIYTLCADNVLTKYGRPRLPWSVKAKLMGVSGSSNGDLRISREQFKQEQNEQQQLHFPECVPLPGAKSLLARIKTAQNRDGYPVEIALASSSEKYNYDRKVVKPETKALMDLIPQEKRVLGDDARVQHGRTPKITPKECLVFEDSVPGVESGRRAGTRVVWVPYPGLAAEYRGTQPLKVLTYPV
ncbi:HAD-like domain containing protein [Rhypophila sp. PSN 637]